MINTYLFDVEYFSSREGDDESPLWQQEREIQSFASRVPGIELQEVYQKYQKQNRELMAEIEWRRANQKSPNPIREQVQKALYDLLVSFESLLQGTKSTQARERQKEKVHIENTIVKPAMEKKSLVEIAIETGTKIFPEETLKKELPIKENVLEKDEILQETKNQKLPPSPKVVEEPRKQTQKLPSSPKTAEEPRRQTQRLPSSPKIAEESRKQTQKLPSSAKQASGEPKKQTQALPSVPKKSKKTEIEEMVFEEALSSDDPSLQEKQLENEEQPATPEARIEKMIAQYLDKRPKVDWREREKQEEEIRKKFYQKEREKKEEREREEQKKTKMTTLKLWGKEKGKQKKNWWPF